MNIDPSRYEPFFRPFEGAGLRLRNRIVMAPMTRRKAPDDRVPEETIAAYYERRARHGVGLIITEGTHIDDEHAPDSENVPGIFTDAQQEGWIRVVEAVHRAGGAIVMQLWHTGRHAMDPIGPSALPAPKHDGGFKPTPRAMSEQDMLAVRDHFAEGAARAMAAGFDGVEIHGAHGYILDSFLSETSNQRTDSYGGSFENRMRYPLQVVRAVREAVGEGYPILYRFSQWKSEDYQAVTFPDPDTLGLWVNALREAGVDMLHVSTRDAVEPAFDGSSPTLAGLSRSLSGLPTIAVGRVSVSTSMNQGERVQVTDPAPAADLIRDGEADLIAIGRALISNPDWCEKVRAGRWQELVPYERTHLAELR